MTSFSNLENKASVASVHKYNPATWLSGVKPDLKAPGPSMSATIDQIIAGRIGQETALPSMEVCSEGETQAVACEAGFGCLYSSTLVVPECKLAFADGVQPAQGFRTVIR